VRGKKNEQKELLIQAITKCIELRFELTITPPCRHVDEYEISLRRWPREEGDVQMDIRYRIIPPFIYSHLPQELDRLVERFRRDVDKVYNQNREG